MASRTPRLVASCAAVGALSVVGAMSLHCFTEAGSPVSVSTEEAAPPRFAQVTEAARSASAAFEQDIVEALTSRPSAEPGETASLEIEVDTAKRTYGKLFALRDFFDKGRIEEATFDRMAASSAQIALAESILGDARFAGEAFGGEQAVARVYAIKFLTYLTRYGDDAPILATIARMRASLTQNGEQARAQSEDLVALVRAYSAFVDKEQAEKNPQSILASLGIQGEDRSSGHATMVSQAIFSGLALGLNGKLSRERLNELLTSTFPETASDL